MKRLLLNLLTKLPRHHFYWLMSFPLFQRLDEPTWHDLPWMDHYLHGAQLTVEECVRFGVPRENIRIRHDGRYFITSIRCTQSFWDHLETPF